MSYNGWMIPDDERARVLAMFVPRYSRVRASHVTLSLGDNTIPQDADIVIVGYTTDGTGVEALVVSVNGSVKRPDGRIYHITLSIAEDRASKESNDVIATHGWHGIDPVPISTRGFVSSGDGYITTPLSQ